MRIVLPLATAVALSVALVVTLPAASEDIVIYASDVDVLSGAWTKVASTTAVGGQMLTTADAGFATPDVPIAAPQHYFEAEFDAQAATAYHVWLRLRGAADSKWNESVWVQFDKAVSSSGNPLWRIGSSSALLVNLENCSGCGISGWGWQDGAWWLNQPATVRFATGGPQTIRVQVREDGVSVDQIVLSPATWLSSAPGGLKNDTTIVPKSSGNLSLTVVRQPYVQNVQAARATIVWATRENGIANVRYTRNSITNVAAAQSRLVSKATTGLGFDYYQHEATLNNLSPSSVYAYTPTVGGTDVSPGGQFRTAPPVGTGVVRFIAFGDSGVGSVEQHQLAALMANDQFDFALHTGDVVYGTSAPTFGGGYPELQSWFFDVYRAWLRHRPIFPSIGNHDDAANDAAPYRDVFVLPTNGRSTAFPDHAERFYSFDYGRAHIVVLDTERAFQNLTRRQAQLQWLESDLANTTLPWKIAVFHRSPYAAGGEHGSDLTVRSVFAPVFDKYHVDLALSGHEHTYERSVPIKETADGGPTVYVVTGGGGARLYPSAKAWWTAAGASKFHYMRAVIQDDCRLSLQAIGLDGNAFDAATVDRCNPAPVVPPSPAYGSTPARIPGIIQAEHFDESGKNVAYADTTPGNSGGVFRATDVDIQATSDTGGGYNVGWIKPGEWLTYTVNITQSRTYTLKARVASNGPGGTFHIEVDGVNVSGPLTIPATGGHQVWTTISKSVTLSAGTRALRLVFDASSATGAFGNINYLQFE